MDRVWRTIGVSLLGRMMISRMSVAGSCEAISFSSIACLLSVLETHSGAFSVIALCIHGCDDRYLRWRGNIKTLHNSRVVDVAKPLKPSGPVLARFLQVLQFQRRVVPKSPVF
jgi:hypothetical protein